ncbi:unnamed protein product [Candidula unifasciata]|uniref:5' exonuclease Apollo n=1 Tax=Candidula unifasciata TaxID=100452 RepID=A0A8S3YNP3_9EUPU|nr:unnamed protein product [Candidula unifasciata]
MNGHILYGTNIAVDYWKIQGRGNNFVHFLTHLHGDHIVGLTSSWHKPIYCSEFTAHLLTTRHGLPVSLLRVCELNQSKLVSEPGCQGFTVTAYDANHCPGAVMFYFQGDFGNILYTGDFRSSPQLIETCSHLVGNVDILYLDNTFCSPKCVFPSRDECLSMMVNVIQQHPLHHVLIGVRKLGKESLLAKIGVTLNETICVSPACYYMSQMLFATDVFTTSSLGNTCRIKTVPMHTINRRFIEQLNATRPTIAIIPSAIFTGLDCQPYSQDSNIFLIPYSDHCSYAELLEFVSTLRPARVLPIVQQQRGPFGADVSDRTDMGCFQSFLLKDRAGKHIAGDSKWDSRLQSLRQFSEKTKSSNTEGTFLKERFDDGNINSTQRFSSLSICKLEQIFHSCKKSGLKSRVRGRNRSATHTIYNRCMTGVGCKRSATGVVYVDCVADENLIKDSSIPQPSQRSSDITPHPTQQNSYLPSLHINSHPTHGSDIPSHPTQSTDTISHPTKSSDTTSHTTQSSDTISHSTQSTDTTSHFTQSSYVTSHPTQQMPCLTSLDILHPTQSSHVISHPAQQNLYLPSSDITSHSTQQKPCLTSSDIFSHPTLSSNITSHPTQQNLCLPSSDTTSHSAQSSANTSHPTQSLDTTSQPPQNSETPSRHTQQNPCLPGTDTPSHPTQLEESLVSRQHSNILHASSADLHAGDCNHIWGTVGSVITHPNSPNGNRISGLVDIRHIDLLHGCSVVKSASTHPNSVCYCGIAEPVTTHNSNSVHDSSIVMSADIQHATSLHKCPHSGKYSYLEKERCGFVLSTPSNTSSGSDAGKHIGSIKFDHHGGAILPLSLTDSSQVNIGRSNSTDPPSSSQTCLVSRDSTGKSFGLADHHHHQCHLTSIFSGTAHLPQQDSFKSPHRNGFISEFIEATEARNGDKSAHSVCRQSRFPSTIQRRKYNVLKSKNNGIGSVSHFILSLKEFLGKT